GTGGATGASWPMICRHLIIGDSLTPRQINVGPSCLKRTFCPSVVRAGAVHDRVILPALREIVKSAGGRGNSSDGGRGAPREPQAVSNANTDAISASFRYAFM